MSDRASSQSPPSQRRNVLGRVGAWLKGDFTAVPTAASGPELRNWKRDIDACAKEQGGPVASRTRALGLIGLYHAMDAPTRLEALLALAVDLKPDPQPLQQAFGDYVSHLGSAQEWQMETRLRAAVASPRARVIRQIGAVLAGVRFLVEARAEVLEHLKAMPELQVLDAELVEQLGRLVRGWLSRIAPPDLGFAGQYSRKADGV